MAWTVLADASRAAKQKAASAAAAGIRVRMRGLVVFIYGNFSAAFLVIYYCDYTKADARMQAFSAFGQECAPAVSALPRRSLGQAAAGFLPSLRRKAY